MTDLYSMKKLLTLKATSIAITLIKRYVVIDISFPKKRVYSHYC